MTWSACSFPNLQYIFPVSVKQSAPKVGIGRSKVGGRGVARLPGRATASDGHLDGGASLGLHRGHGGGLEGCQPLQQLLHYVRHCRRQVVVLARVGRHVKQTVFFCALRLVERPGPGLPIAALQKVVDALGIRDASGREVAVLVLRVGLPDLDDLHIAVNKGVAVDQPGAVRVGLEQQPVARALGALTQHGPQVHPIAKLVRWFGRVYEGLPVGASGH
mmetsp:Transcript_26643/g.70062  ORF Transcript_26643/g.70062 Transcript_26643/m.70062 type:complete len:218 (+) Transcript_26643:945-1598(+)